MRDEQGRSPQNDKVHEWILEEQIKSAIIDIVKRGEPADAVFSLATRVLMNVLGDIRMSESEITRVHREMWEAVEEGRPYADSEAPPVSHAQLEDWAKVLSNYLPLLNSERND